MNYYYHCTHCGYTGKVGPYHENCDRMAYRHFREPGDDKKLEWEKIQRQVEKHRERVELDALKEKLRELQRHRPPMEPDEASVRTVADLLSDALTRVGREETEEEKQRQEEPITKEEAEKAVELPSEIDMDFFTKKIKHDPPEPKKPTPVDSFDPTEEDE